MPAISGKLSLLNRDRAKVLRCGSPRNRAQLATTIVRITALAVLGVALTIGPDARAIATYEFASSDPGTTGFLVLDISSASPGIRWDSTDIIDFRFTIAGYAVAFGDSDIDFIKTGQNPGHPLAPLTTEEAPFSTFTNPELRTEPSRFNNFLSVKMVDGELFEVFRDLAIHCSAVPCTEPRRTEIPMRWNVVPEPTTAVLTLAGLAILACRRVRRAVAKHKF